MEASDLWWVFGGICRQTKEIFVVIVEDRSRNTLAKAIYENIDRGSFVYSDCWRAYRRLEELDIDLVHKTVNHSQHFVNRTEPDVYTNTIERSWRSLRENIPLQIGRDAVESYIEKFMFFHNAGCKDTKSRFDAMIRLCKHFFPLY